MLALSGTKYRMYANVVHSMVTDWCMAGNKIPDTQFGFYPGRSTLQPIFILRHLQHAARTLQPRQSGRLHTAFIDFKQAFDTIPRQALWQHLQRTRMTGFCVTHMLYADDLTLTANDHNAMQKMLDRLHMYAQRKH
jgi:hypothetical protein